jgi:hypothetical protein
MVFAKSLELGTCGVQWQPPAGTIGEHTETELVVLDDSGLRWRIRHLPTEFAIAAGEEAALSEDLYLSARAAFEARWARQPRPTGAQPRTASGEWSPIIEAKIGNIGEGRVARVLRRLAYEQGDEVVVGHVFLPVEHGTIELRVMASSPETGIRERAIATKYGGKQAQATYDAGELDAYFPDHPLSRVRDALDTAQSALDIVALPQRPAEVSLAEAGCAVTAPLRFVAAPETKGSGRGELVRLGVDDWQRVIDVLRVGRHKFKLQKSPHAALVDHANQVAAEWRKLGCEAIQSHAAPIDDYGVCAQVQHYVTFERDGEARHSVYRWWIAGDGTLWRIGEDAPIQIDRQALADEVAQVQDSFRRI